MSLEEFGQYLGYGQARTAARQVMSRILNNHRNLTLEDLSKLQSGGVDLNWLISGVGEIKELGEESPQKFAIYHFYDGAEYVETLKIPEFKYPEIINMQSDEIFAVRIKTEMMSSTIKVNETVNAVKVDSIKHDGIYILIDEIDGEEVMSVRRFFINLDRSSYQVIHDNPSYPDTEISNETIEKNRLILRVFSIMQTIVKI